MIDITLNGEPETLPMPLSIQQLIERIGLDPRKIAVEVNREVVPKARHSERCLQAGDAVEIVTLVGGGAQAPNEPSTAVVPPIDKRLRIGTFSFHSRLITGTGKYANYDLMRDCLHASGCEVTTVAVRRERLINKEG